MKRKFLLFGAMLFIVIGLSLTVHAAANAYVANPGLSFNGTTAYCSVVYRGDSAADTISATLTLYRGNTVSQKGGDPE